MCEVCNKFLTNSSNMKKHIQTHGINAEPIGKPTIIKIFKFHKLEITSSFVFQKQI